VRWRWLRSAAGLAVAVWIACPMPAASAFGTIDGAGQHREHERITRAALACHTGAPDDCFQPGTADYLAGHGREFGAVGAPDVDEVADPAAHCDNGDFLEGSYPRSRDEATAALLACVDHLRASFADGVDRAGGLLDHDGEVVAAEVDVDPQCPSVERAGDRAKCTVLAAFGRVLHGVQDFYAHSNWADDADPTRPSGLDNPPGLNLRGPSPVLDLRSEAPPVVPAGLATGCFVLRDQVPGVGECSDRITHAALNKDDGLIDPVTGEATDPTTPRGRVGENFAQAVAGAIAESRRQWQDFRDALAARYGDEHAARMVCSLTHDDPAADCTGRPGTVVLAGLVGVGVVVSSAVLVRSRYRRRG
jgi:hypothetical protein